MSKRRRPRPVNPAAGELAASMNSLVLRLEQFTRLSDDDRRLLAAVTTRTRRVAAREDIIREGEPARGVNVILSGWACRYKVLEDGRRQTVALFVPGDLHDVNVFILRRMDHSIGAITAVTYAEIGRETFEDIAGRHPRIMRAMWWDTLVAMATQREWTLNVGQRSALERIGHLLCELFIRLRAIGLTRGDTCEFPLTQTDIADATGLTPVHVNRTLQDMRARGLVVLRGRELTIPDLDALRSVSLFNDNYLHLESPDAAKPA